MNATRPSTLLIHQAFVSPSEGGGTRHYELLQHLVARGHRVTIVASSRDYLSAELVRTEETAEPYGDAFRVLRAYTHSSLHRGYMWRVFSTMTFAVASVPTALGAGPVDVVMGTTPPMFQAVSSWIVALLRRRPFLLEVRDLWPEFAIGLGILKNRILINVARWLERFLYSRATHIVVNSPAYRDYLLAKGIFPDKISLIPNGVEPAMFRPEDDGQAVRAELGLTDKIVITYAGALGLANDLDTLLRAASRLQQESHIHFLLLGDGKERPALEARIRELRLSNVSILGSQPKSRIPEFLAASRACVALLKDIPMFRTTYPNKIFDYMAAGRPTILAIDGVIRDVIEASNGGVFVPPGDDAALAEAVRVLAADPQGAARMGASARAYVVEHFHRRAQAEEFRKLICRLARVSDWD